MRHLLLASLLRTTHTVNYTQESNISDNSGPRFNSVTSVEPRDIIDAKT